MDKFYFWILAVGFLSCVYATIKITELRVPESISLGDNITEVEFDCIYEVVNETGLEVKWFYNGEYQQIYQWIPGYPKRGSPMGFLKNYIDLNYVVTNDSDTEYRGFRIKNISQDLSGNYTCKISSNLHEVSDTKQMIIYSPADSPLELSLYSNDGIVFCSVNDISPQPKVDFYILFENGTRLELDEEVKASDPDSEGLFNITAIHNFSQYNHTLRGPTTFVCNMSIPGTSYFLSKEVIHLAEQENVTDVALLNETIVAGNNVPETIVITTTPRGSSAIYTTAISYMVLILALLLIWK